MPSVFKLVHELGPAGLVLKAILASVLGIVVLVGLIVTRRWWRGRYFRRLEERTIALRAMWDDIVAGRIEVKDWRLDRLDCSIVETILLDTIEVATVEQLPALLSCLRSSGLLDTRIREARMLRGWRQRAALVALGRTRALEAVPALSEALDSPSAETRIAAVRGLGRTGRVEAGLQLLDHLATGDLQVPEHSLKSALVHCCREAPAILLPYLSQAPGKTRELLARVLAEVAGPESENELLALAADELSEVRASVARALGSAEPAFALPVLITLAEDREWFVRLRAVVALGTLQHPGVIAPLLHAVRDSNREVRRRAAWALVRMEPWLDRILNELIETGDTYALEVFISELERDGTLEKVAAGVQAHLDPATVQRVLLEALVSARHKKNEEEKGMLAAVNGGR